MPQFTVRRLQGEIDVRLEGARNFTKAQQGFAKVRKSIGSLRPSLTALGTAFTAFRRILSGLGSVLRTVWSWMQRVAIAGVALAGGLAYGYIKLGRSITETAKSFEALRAQMDVVFGAGGRDLYKWVEDFSKPIAASTEEVVQAAITLGQFGMEVKRFLPLAAELAGALGRPITEAAGAIAMGAVGETERLKTFGIASRMLQQYGARAGAGGGTDVQTIEGIQAYKDAIAALISDKYTGGIKRFQQTLKGAELTLGSLYEILRARIGEAGLLQASRRYIEALSTAISRLMTGGAWDKFVSSLTSVMSWWPRFKEAIVMALPSLMDSATRLLENIRGSLGDPEQAGAKLKNTIDDVVPKIIKKLGDVYDWFSKSLPFAIDTAQTIFQGFANMFARSMAFIRELLQGASGPGGAIEAFGHAFTYMLLEVIKQVGWLTAELASAVAVTGFAVAAVGAALGAPTIAAAGMRVGIEAMLAAGLGVAIAKIAAKEEPFSFSTQATKKIEGFMRAAGERPAHAWQAFRETQVPYPAAPGGAQMPGAITPLPGGLTGMEYEGQYRGAPSFREVPLKTRQPRRGGGAERFMERERPAAREGYRLPPEALHPGPYAPGGMWQRDPVNIHFHLDERVINGEYIRQQARTEIASTAGHERLALGLSS